MSSLRRRTVRGLALRMAARARVHPLAALDEYVLAQVEPLADGLQRTVLLRDDPRAGPR